MFMFPFALLDPKAQARIQEHNQRERERRIAAAVPWTADTKWQRELNLQAASYKPLSIFDVAPTHRTDPNKAPKASQAISADGRWLYLNKQLPTGTKLSTMIGNRNGTVMFDGPAIIPALHNRWSGGDEGSWREEPFMSLTPMEFLSLRAGTRLARGHVVIGGLGLGHQLIEVSKKRSVKKITVVERCQDLVDFVWTHIQPHVKCPVEIVVDDAKVAIPKMTADVALIDIFPHYGGNEFPRCPSIKRVWCWGASFVGNTNSW